MCKVVFVFCRFRWKRLLAHLGKTSPKIQHFTAWSTYLQNQSILWEGTHSSVLHGSLPFRFSVRKIKVALKYFKVGNIYAFKPGSPELIFLSWFFFIFRILWVLVVIGAIIFFSMQVKDRIAAYLRHESIVNFEVRYTDKLEYPAITICNQNTFRWEWHHSSERKDINYLYFSSHKHHWHFPKCSEPLVQWISWL